MAADALAPCDTKTSTAMLSIMQHKCFIAFNYERRISTTCAILVLRNDRKGEQIKNIKD